MIYLIEIVVYLLLLFHSQTQGFNDEILLINGPSEDYKTTYTIIPSNDRIKRDRSPWFYPEIDKNEVSCGHNIYAELHTCSQLTECRALSTCLESLHCPLDIKSIGGLIINLLRLLGINNCHIDDQNRSCPNVKRANILKELFTHWTKTNDHIYCDIIPNFMMKVKNVINNQCPFNSRQVEALLENYRCSSSRNATTSTRKTIVEKSTTSFIEMNYIDEDDEMKFINSNKNLYNNTEQDVYINDHLYYNVSYIVSKSEGIPMNFVDDNNQFIRIHALSNRHRSAFGINLKFGFPFYGHTIHKILVATGGFIYTGDLLHAALIGSTQYIAPFMANFDASIGNNDTEIKYMDNGTHFVCTWKKVYLQDQQEVGPFIFQAILQNTGNIYFNYLQIPTVKISSVNHAHRLGLSDAYLSQHATNEHIMRVITLYDKINLDREKIKNGLSIVFYMDQTCNTFTDCPSCLANRGKRHNCSWCDDIQKCSDGFDRSRQQWIRAQCHRSSSQETCPNSLEDTFDNRKRPLSSSMSTITQFKERKASSIDSSRQSSTFQTFRIILVTLLFSVLILSLGTLAVTYIYAYRNPTSPAGMWLLEHRPTTYLARFKRFTGSN